MIFVGSPYAGDIKRNMEYARELCREICMRSKIVTVAPHLLVTQYLNDDKPQERAMGMMFSERLIDVSEMAIFGIDHGISVGMMAEMRHCAETRKLYGLLRMEEIKNGTLERMLARIRGEAA